MTVCNTEIDFQQSASKVEMCYFISIDNNWVIKYLLGHIVYSELLYIICDEAQNTSLLL